MTCRGNNNDNKKLESRETGELLLQMIKIRKKRTGQERKGGEMQDGRERKEGYGKNGACRKVRSKVPVRGLRLKSRIQAEGVIISAIRCTPFSNLLHCPYHISCVATLFHDYNQWLTSDLCTERSFL